MPIPLILRAQKGAALTFDEVDGNFVAIAEVADAAKDAAAAIQDGKGRPNGYAELDASGSLAQRSKVAADTDALAIRDAGGAGAAKSATMVASRVGTITGSIVIKTGVWQDDADATCHVRANVNGNAAVLNKLLDVTLQFRNYSTANGTRSLAYVNNGGLPLVVFGAKHADGYWCWILSPISGQAWTSVAVVELVATLVRSGNAAQLTDNSAKAWSILFPTASELATYTNVAPAVEDAWALTPTDINVAGGVAGLNPALRLNYASEILATAMAGNHGRTFVAPAALHSNSSATITGCFVIKLSNVTAMHTVRARAFNYGAVATRGVSEFTASLYHTNGQASGSWATLYQSQYGTLPIPISMANETSTGRRCVIVGTPTTPWNFPALNVLDSTSHRSTIAQANGGESVDVEWATNLDAYNSIVDVPDTGPNSGKFTIDGFLANGVDANTLTKPGANYGISRNDTGATLLNWPFAGAGAIEVFPWATQGYVAQLGLSYSGGGRLGLRFQTNATTFSDWQEFARLQSVGGTLPLASIPQLPLARVTGAAPLASPVFTGSANVGPDVNQRATVGPGHVDLKSSVHGGFVDMATADATDFDWRIKNDSSGTTLGTLGLYSRSGGYVLINPDGNIYSTRLGAMVPGLGFYVADAISALNSTLNSVKARTDGGNGLVHTLTGNTIDQYWNGTGVVVRIDGNANTDRRFWDTTALPNPATTAITNDLQAQVTARVIRDGADYMGFFGNNPLRPYMRQSSSGNYIEIPVSSGVQRVAHGGSYVEILASDGVARGVSYNVSDRNKKKNIKPSTASALGVIDLFRFFSFFYRADSGMDPTLEYSIGAMAQDMEAIDSTFVQTLSDGTKMPVTMPLLMLALKANQELNEKLRLLTQRVEELERQNG